MKTAAPVCLCCAEPRRFDNKTPQRLIGAASLLIAAYALFVILWPLRWSLLSTWAVVELVYYVLYWRPRYFELNEQPARHEPPNLETTAMKTFQRFLRFCKELPSGNIDYEAYYSGWFRGAPFDQIKRGACLVVWLVDAAAQAHRLIDLGSSTMLGALHGRASECMMPPLSSLPALLSWPCPQATPRSLWRMASGIARASRCRPRGWAGCQRRWSTSWRQPGASSLHRVRASKYNHSRRAHCCCPACCVPAALRLPSKDLLTCMLALAGYNADIRFMGHLWEPLGASWRPMVFYLCTGLIGMSARQLLRRWGFEHHKHKWVCCCLHALHGVHCVALSSDPPTTAGALRRAQTNLMLRPPPTHTPCACQCLAVLHPVRKTCTCPAVACHISLSTWASLHAQLQPQLAAAQQAAAL